MIYNDLYWSNMDGPDSTDHLSDFELWSWMVFNRGQIRPSSKKYLKNDHHKWLNMDKLDMVYH